MVNCQLRNYFKGRGRKWAWSKAEGGGVLGFKNFWDGVYNFFFLPPPRYRHKNLFPIYILHKYIDVSTSLSNDLAFNDRLSCVMLYF